MGRRFFFLSKVLPQHMTFFFPYYIVFSFFFHFFTEKEAFQGFSLAYRNLQPRYSSAVGSLLSKMIVA